MERMALERAPNPSAATLLAEIREDNPGRRFAINVNGTGIGDWDDERGRYVTFLGWGVHGRWIRLPCELLVNGRPFDVYPNDDDAGSWPEGFREWRAQP